jgi:hypothetical protein
MFQGIVYLCEELLLDLNFCNTVLKERSQAQCKELAPAKDPSHATYSESEKL